MDSKTMYSELKKKKINYDQDVPICPGDAPCEAKKKSEMHRPTANETDRNLLLRVLAWVTSTTTNEEEETVWDKIKEK